MSDEYFVLEIPANNPKGYCALDALDGFDDEWEVSQGTSLIDNPPEQLSMCMYAEEPRNKALSDYVENMDSLMVVSLRLKMFFESQNVTFIEYYPLKITDHKGKIVKDEYFVAHMTDHIDCINADASGVEWEDQGSNTQTVLDIQKFVLDTVKIPAERKIFYPKFYSDYPVIRGDLAKVMKKEGFTNVEVVPLDDCVC